MIIYAYRRYTSPSPCIICQDLHYKLKIHCFVELAIGKEDNALLICLHLVLYKLLCLWFKPRAFARKFYGDLINWGLGLKCTTSGSVFPSHGGVQLSLLICFGCPSSILFIISMVIRGKNYSTCWIFLHDVTNEKNLHDVHCTESSSETYENYSQLV